MYFMTRNQLFMITWTIPSFIVFWKNSSFTVIATHELKSPIHLILGFAELAKIEIMPNDNAWDGVVV